MNVDEEDLRQLRARITELTNQRDGLDVRWELACNRAREAEQFAQILLTENEALRAALKEKSSDA